MSQFFKERFIGRDNQDVYASEYERIFGKKEKDMNHYNQDGTLSSFSEELDELEESRQKIIELEAQLKEAHELIDMVEDNRKMPHQHADFYLRLSCLSERAVEYKAKHKLNDD